MRPTLPTGDALDALLTAAATDFVNDPASEAAETLRAELDAASGYEVVFRDYDWSLNDRYR